MTQKLLLLIAGSVVSNFQTFEFVAVMRAAHVPVFPSAGEETFYFLLFCFQYCHGCALLKSSFLGIDFFSIFFTYNVPETGSVCKILMQCLM